MTFRLKLQHSLLLLIATDTVETIRTRAARKLAIPNPAEISLQYLYVDVYYVLDDGKLSLPLLPRRIRSTESVADNRG